MTPGLPKKSIFRGKPQKRVVKNLEFYSRIIPGMCQILANVIEHVKG